MPLGKRLLVYFVGLVTSATLHGFFIGDVRPVETVMEDIPSQGDSARPLQLSAAAYAITNIVRQDYAVTNIVRHIIDCHCFR